MSALYDHVVAAFDEAGWPRGATNAAGTLGTALERDGRTIGGAVTVVDGVVRFLAFGVDAPDERRGAFDALFGVVNPALPMASFEMHPVLGPVCRASADVSDAGDDAAVRGIVVDLAANATTVFAGFVEVLEAVAGGADPHAVLEDAGWAGDLPAATGPRSGGDR